MIFEEFIKDLSSKLPFGVTFDVRPSKRATGKPTTLIEGIEVNIYDDVSVSEKWFFDILDELNQTKAIELQVEMKLLGVALFEEFNKDENGKPITDEDKLIIVSLSDAINLLFNAVDFLESLPNKTKAEKELKQRYSALLESKQHDSFVIRHTENYEKLANLSKMVQTNHALKWMSVTFFLMARLDGEWSFSDTASLTVAELDEVYKWIELERNKGVAPGDPIIEVMSEEEELKKT